MSEKIKQENLHKGHRNRMRKKYLMSGADSMPTHELVEILLYYCIPQKDTNELAHQLLERFGSIEGLLSSSPDELSSVSGIKESASVLISLVNALNRRREVEKALPPKVFDDEAVTGEYLVGLFNNISVERFYVILLDNSMRHIETVCISEGSVNANEFNVRRIVEQAFFRHASNVIIAHNHPGGRVIPSMADIDATRDLNAALSLMGINLVEHFLVADEKYTTLLHRSCKY